MGGEEFFTVGSYIPGAHALNILLCLHLNKAVFFFGISVPAARSIVKVSGQMAFSETM